mmetsp:Transcript_20093/g.32699  ORF Transcript_20093/g.32699 Transcript_20093/m.32699 type:complete len:203 (-) Transcript_20093:100-708(-)
MRPATLGVILAHRRWSVTRNLGLGIFFLLSSVGSSSGSSRIALRTAVRAFGAKKEIGKMNAGSPTADHCASSASAESGGRDNKPIGIGSEENPCTAAQESTFEQDACRKKTRPNKKAERERRKQEARLMKQQRKAKREGKRVTTKKCDLCGKDVQLLIRCQIDQSRKWNLVCGKCWKTVSGGIVDGDADHPYYKYGGLWKSR